MEHISDNGIVDSTVERKPITPLRMICAPITAAKDSDDDTIVGQTILDQVPALERWLAEYGEFIADIDYALEFTSVVTSVRDALAALDEALAKVHEPTDRPVVASFCSEQFDGICRAVDLIDRLFDDDEDERWTLDWRADDARDERSDDGKATNLNPSAETSGSSDLEYQPQDTTPAVSVPVGDDDEPWSERDLFRAEFRKTLSTYSEWPEEEEEAELDYAEACRFDYLIDPDTFGDLFRVSQDFKRSDKRAPQIGAQALIAAGAPLRRAKNGRFAFDGLRWRSDNVQATFAAWWQDACPKITRQLTSPVWLREVSNLRRGGHGYELARHTERHDMPPTAEERYTVERSGSGAVITPMLGGGRFMVHSFSYDGLPWSVGMKELFEQWEQSPEQAIEAVFKALPEEEAMIEDPVVHLSTPSGLLRFNADGVIDQYTEPGTARRLGITRITAPLPDLPAGVDLADLDWREYAPVYAECFDLFQTDASIRDWFQRAYGYTLYGRAHEKLAILLFGPVDTGKTTLLAPLVYAAGLYGTTIKPQVLFRAGSARDTLADLRGLRMVTVSVGEMLGTAEVGKLEQLSGVAPMPGGWRNQAVIWGEARTVPRFMDTTPLERRLRVIPCVRQLDPHEVIKSKIDHVIEHELPGVLLFGLQGVQQYLERGLDDVPLAISQSSMLVVLAGDVVRGFVRLLAPSATPVPFATLYAQFQRLCALVQRDAPGRNVLSAAVTSAGYTIKPGKGNVRVVNARLPMAGDLPLLSGGEPLLLG